MDLSICDTFLTGHKIESFLRNYSKINGHRLLAVEAEIAGESEGLTSKVLRVKLDWSTTESSLPVSVIIKVIGGDKNIKDAFNEMPEKDVDELITGVQQVHDTECSVYELPGLSEMVPLPKCFAAIRNTATQPGIIILEDLSQCGVVMPMRTFGLGLDEKQLDQIVDALASTHAWSVKTDTDWCTIILPLDQIRCLVRYIDLQLNYYEPSKKAYPQIFEKLDEEKFKALINFENYMKIYGSDPRIRYNLPLVLVHGDTHLMNMIWERRSGSTEAGDCLLALLDWQAAHQGCGIEDLVRLFILCMSTKMRRENGDTILKRYVQIFNAKLKNPDHQIKFEDVKRAFDEMYAFTEVLNLCWLRLQESFQSKMVNSTEYQKMESKKRIIGNTIAVYQDAVKILQW